MTPFEGLHLKIPTILPIKGKGLINQGLGYHNMRRFARRESFFYFGLEVFFSWAWSFRCAAWGQGRLGFRVWGFRVQQDGK